MCTFPSMSVGLGCKAIDRLLFWVLHPAGCYGGQDAGEYRLNDGSGAGFVYLPQHLDLLSSTKFES
ncbi:hypothetical protein ACQ4M4_01985 [Leptolyngbya sp. AN02str]|uniref:hypothetical protein n=1 Tax=Leptolyngbya sp. AN02str TaxID=3423363 RepID=UPI003D31AD40